MLEPNLGRLRIYVEDTVGNDAASNLAGFTELANQFEGLTGWTLAYQETAASQVRRQCGGAVNAPRAGKLMIDDISKRLATGARPLNRGTCDAFVGSLNQILVELDSCREQIWRQNALLATGIPVSDNTDSAEKLAVLLQSILQTAVDFVGCDSAGLYVLDDATRQLDLRCQVGPHGAGDLECSRELSRCKADLEALLGHAVVLEDATRYQQWQIPRTCGAAVCLPISSANNLLGTMWVFSATSRPFDGRETNMLEILAGRIAAELERFALVQSIRHQNRVAAESIRTPGPRLPNIPPPIDELKISGQTAKGERDVSLAGAVYDWSICRRGQLAFVVGFALETTGLASLAATVLQTAFAPTPRIADRRSSYLTPSLRHSCRSVTAISRYGLPADTSTPRRGFASLRGLTSRSAGQPIRQVEGDGFAANKLRPENLASHTPAGPRWRLATKQDSPLSIKASATRIMIGISPAV